MWESEQGEGQIERERHTQVCHECGGQRVVPVETITVG